jgi:hypothetical protein
MNDRTVSTVGRETDRVKPNYSKKKSSPVQLAHHKFHMHGPGNELGNSP